MAERDYVLGTHDVEIERLGLQHRVWRDEMLRGWQAAGIGAGSKVVDVGAGPGHATLDLASLVGPGGQVAAIERSTRFIAHAEAQCQQRGFSQVRFLERDLMEEGLGVSEMDAVWCRWVACFVPDPCRLVANIGGALRSGGKVVFHDYVDYGAWRIAPDFPLHQEFVQEVIDNWRASGGEPNIGVILPSLLQQHGFVIDNLRPITFAITPADQLWQWPLKFIESHVPRLVELGRIDHAKGQAILDEFSAAAAVPGMFMITPIVLEIVATKS